MENKNELLNKIIIILLSMLAGVGVLHIATILGYLGSIAQSTSSTGVM